MSEQCDSCGEAYDFSPANARLFLFIEDPQCNYVEAKCPKGHSERSYVKPDGATRVLGANHLHITLAARATEQLRTLAADAWARQTAAVREVPVPREWMTELYDDLRNWKGVI